MGCICSKGIGIFRHQQDHNKFPKPLIQESKNEPKSQNLQRNNEYILTRTISKSQENAIVPQLAIFEGKNNVPVPIIIDGQIPPPQRSLSATSHNHRVSLTTTVANIEQSFDLENELVSPDWPSWLSSVAGDAIRGLIPRKADSFMRFNKIGQGTYSNVFKALDLQNDKIVALKKVRFVNMDPESVRFMAREISILRKLDHPNVIKLEGVIASTTSDSLYLVFEYMEHDLAGLVAISRVKFTEPQVKCLMKQLLDGLKHCHSRGVLHRDIKGSNLLIDKNGVLKIADFGLATTIDPNKKQKLTSRVVTLWYRPPELLLGATDYGASVDLWSTGCILAELLAGKPIMPGRTEVEQMHKIFKLCGSPPEVYFKKSFLSHSTVFKPEIFYQRCIRETFREFSSSALDLLDVLLAMKPEDRGTSALALGSEFFTRKPYACDPTSLPKFPPSKEFDARIQNEAQRKRTEDVKVKESEYTKNGGIMDSSARGPSSLQKAHTQMDAYRSERRENSRMQTNGLHIAKSQNSLSLLNPSSSVHPSANFDDPSWTKMTKNRKDTQSFLSRSSSSSVRLHDFRSCEPKTTDIMDFSILPEKKERKSTKEPSSMKSCQSRKLRYSGPLIPPGCNMEDMLKEHERQIQHAVREARKTKSKKIH